VTALASPERFVVDSSALLALIEDEPGADRVATVLGTGNAVVPWIALLEVRYITLQERGAVEAEQRQSYILAISADVDWIVDPALLARAAAFKAGPRLSFADCLVAAYAVKHGAVLLHKDPEFERLPSAVSCEALPYKVSGR
jgi:predicted nucleic acid-binding protein